MQPPLPHHPRPNQLPPRWDGCTIEWEGWQPDYSTLRFHSKQVCAHCGSSARPITNVGRVRVDAPKGVRVLYKVRGYQRGRLYAFRCPDCLHDVVVDLKGDSWDLEESDYEDSGSWA